MISSRILIVGGSTRAAADSVRRAGGQPVCADLFADLDLRQSAEVISVQSYPESLPEDLRHVRADGWFYCGAIENSPSLVERIQTMCPGCGPLLGTPPQTLRCIRDPLWLADALASRGLPTLEVRSEESPPPADGEWLQKPLASAGGRSIRAWTSTSAQEPFAEPHYFQRRAEGVGVSASIQISDGSVRWLGMTKELRGRAGTGTGDGASPIFSPPTAFSYCGSYGPITDDTLQAQLTNIVQAIVEQAVGLRGIVGFDFQFDGATAWLTEVNPRYTASIELIELAHRRSALRSQGELQASNGLIAKRILYATTPFTAPDLSRFLPPGDVWTVPQYADIPVPGVQIEAGWPICSVFATGMNEDELWSQLEQRISTIERALA